MNQRVRQRGDHPACCKTDARERQLSAGLQHLEAATVPQLCVSTQVQQAKGAGRRKVSGRGEQIMTVTLKYGTTWEASGYYIGGIWLLYRRHYFEENRLSAYNEVFLIWNNYIRNS